MSQQSTVNTLRPVYDLVELELDDYEENELVLNTIHDLKLFFENPDNSLEEHELELFIKSQLMSFEISDEKSKNKTQKHIYRYNYNNSLLLCKTAYLKLCGINDYLLSTLQNHLQINGLTERVHGNTGHASKTESRVFLEFNITSTIKQFLIQYGTIHGLPSPLRHQDDSGVFIYLPTSQTYTSVYNEYKKNFYLIHDQPEKIISYSTFKKLWYEMVPNIRFQPPAIQVEYNGHKEAADLERQHYNNNIEESKNNLDITHICYDWAQNVSIPYSPQQVGVSKGANTTLNMIYYFLQKKNPKKKKLSVTCDNCSGQNKNNLLLWFWSWLCSLNWYEEIVINFMLPGHTKFICDSFFGQIKKVYRDNRVNIIDDVENIVNNLSKGNEAIQYKNGKGWVCLEIGKVYASKKSGGEETSFQLLHNNNFDKNSILNILSTVPLSNDRKKYLYTKIRQHVDDPYKDVLCPQP
ncbi:15423_t:CDS:2 [Gigaspora margarita]|uniref:15423_t:CDS:1 n=1 Tax=Gigaspora margarita TaxID=4874 RepID=A0ABM8W0C2_GIGMA|nr:15423_t:CDS:2 [Gigaspora margarita]